MQIKPDEWRWIGEKREWILDLWRCQRHSEFRNNWRHNIARSSFSSFLKTKTRKISSVMTSLENKVEKFRVCVLHFSAFYRVWLKINCTHLDLSDSSNNVHLTITMIIETTLDWKAYMVHVNYILRSAEATWSSRPFPVKVPTYLYEFYAKISIINDIWR